MKFRIIVCLLFGFSSISLHSEGVDIYPNPHLTDPSLAPTFVSKLRAMNIKQMESLINGECNQFNGYVSLSIQNWNDAKKGIKSLNEATSYSQRLITEIPYRQSLQYTFPMGIQTYRLSEEFIKTQLSNGRNEGSLIDEMSDICLRLNNTKYLSLLSSTEYLIGNQPAFISSEQLLKKFNSENSLIKDIKNTPSAEDKLTPKDIATKINFTKKDFEIAYMLINDDIKNSFLDSDIRWIDYKKASRDVQKDFETFMKEGGKNIDFAKIVFYVRILSKEVPKYEEVYSNNIEKKLFQFKKPDKNSLISQKAYISLAQKLNYPISELIK